MKVYIKWLCVIAIISITAPLFAQSTEPVSTLQELIQTALNINPSLKAAKKQVDARQTLVRQSSALPDPVLSLNLMNLPLNTFSFNQEPMTGKQVSLMQAIPFPGKISLRKDIARSGVRTSNEQLNEMKIQLVKNLRMSYYEYYYVIQALKTVRENKGILSRFITIAETRYRVGKGLQQDVLKAQVSLSKLIDKELLLKDKQFKLRTKINELIGRSSNSEIGKPVLENISFIKTDTLTFFKYAIQSRPLVKAWKTMISQNDQKVSLAKRNFYPDFKIGLAYTQRDVLANGSGGVDYLSGLVSVSIPLFFHKKQEQKYQQVRLEGQSILDQYQDVLNHIQSSIEQAISSLNKNEQLIQLYDTGIIPQARQSLESAMSAYQNGKVDFLTLLNSQMSLLDFEINELRARTDYRKDLALLDALQGKPLNLTTK